MYNPLLFNLNNDELSLELIQEYPLGLLISSKFGQVLPETNFYPFVVEREGNQIEGKFKMSQNRDSDDYAGVTTFFETKNPKLSQWLKKTRKV